MWPRFLASGKGLMLKGSLLPISPFAVVSLLVNDTNSSLFIIICWFNNYLQIEEFAKEMLYLKLCVLSALTSPNADV